MKIIIGYDDLSEDIRNTFTKDELDPYELSIDDLSPVLQEMIERADAAFYVKKWGDKRHEEWFPIWEG